MKWIVASHTGWGGWKAHVKCETLSFAQHAFELFSNSDKYEVVAIFRNRPGWETSRPRYLHDERDKANAPIRNFAVKDLINRASSTVL